MQSQAWQDHLRWMRIRALTPDTISQRAGVMRRLAAAHGDRPLLSLTEEELMVWADSLTTRLGLATRAVYVSNVRSFYGWAYHEHLIAADPAANLPVPRTPQRKPRPISEDELVRAVEEARGTPIRLWLILAAWCGLRAKEIALLRGENIRPREDPPYILVADTKGRRERIVPLPPFAADELLRFGVPLRGLCWWNGRRPPTDPPNFVSLMCNRYLHSLGIDDTLHSLRHRFGTQVQRAVRDLRVTQELLGHSTPGTTAGYAQVADMDKYRAVSLLPGLVPLEHTGTDNAATLPFRKVEHP